MNYHIKADVQHRRKKIDVEKLYEDIRGQFRDRFMISSDIGRWKCQVERFDKQPCHSFPDDHLTTG